jgi:hypothetical protein
MKITVVNKCTHVVEELETDHEAERPNYTQGRGKIGAMKIAAKFERISHEGIREYHYAPLNKKTNSL